jgi:ABC-type nitrate/sulfonate/bicarbonate transport system permease component
MVSIDPPLTQVTARAPDGESTPSFTVPNLSGVLKNARLLRVLVVPLLLLALWQLAVNLEFYSRSQLPAPLDVVAAGRELQDIGLLIPNVLASVKRVAIGWGIGSVVAIALGLAVGFSRPVESMLAPGGRCSSSGWVSARRRS